MDTRKDYALLYQFSEQQPPVDCPLTLGMEGTIKDVHFTIIGIVSYRSSFGDRWTDLHLYSETHGYAWLTYQFGHFTFTRRVRYLPDRDMRQLSPREPLRVKDQSFVFFEAYQAEITYVAGELTWIAKVGETSIVRDAIAPPFMFTMEETEDELEYYLTEYIEPELMHNNFAIQQETHRSTIHPAQPFKAPLREALSKASFKFALVAVAALLFISLFTSGKTVLDQRSRSLNPGINTYSFAIDNARHLTEISFNNPYASLWQITDITLFDDEKEVFSFADKLSTHKDHSSQQTGKALFKLDHPGQYTLRVTALRKKASSGNTQPNIRFTVRQGIISTRYFKYLLYLSALGFAIFYISRYLFTSKRWAAAH